MGLGAWKSWGEEGGGRGLQFPGAPVLSLRACRDAAGPWGTGAWGQNRGRRVPGCNDVPRTQQLQVREDVNEVSHTRVAVDPGPQDTGRALLGALTQPQLCLVAHDQGRCGTGNIRLQLQKPGSTAPRRPAVTHRTGTSRRAPGRPSLCRNGT